MQSKATTVPEYLDSLPDDRRRAVEAIRKEILANLDGDYEEGMQWGMIGYYVPHRLFPAGYHTDPRQPLPFASLASQKNHLSLYLSGLYCGCAEGKGGDTPDMRWFRQAWEKTGKKLDMGKSCVRFKRIEDVPLQVVGEAIRRIPAKRYIERYQQVLGEQKGGKTAGPGGKGAAAGKGAASARKPVKKPAGKTARASR
jgi:hypothetical protein